MVVLFVNQLQMPQLLTTEEFIRKAKLIHLDRYDYSKTIYTGKDNQLIITCSIHGDFKQIAADHANKGCGCRLCGKKLAADKRRKHIDTFIKQANLIHNNFYDYSKLDYISALKKAEIICPEHGSFYQRPVEHLKGYRCVRCASEKSDHWGWSKEGWLIRSKTKFPKLYVVNFYSEEESFIKVGITSYKLLNSRLSQVPYKYNVLHCVKANGEIIWNLENKIKRELRRIYKYKPSKLFGGMYECYQLNSFNEILKICLKEKLEFLDGQLDQNLLEPQNLT